MNVKLVTCWVRRCGTLVFAAAIFLSAHTSALAKPPADRPPKHIVVSLSQQHMVAWQGDKVVFEFPVTTGQDGQETIPGEYEVLDKEVAVYSDGWRLNLPYCDIFEIEAGRIVAHRLYEDQMEFAAQLGLLPDPAAAPA